MVWFVPDSLSPHKPAKRRQGNGKLSKPLFVVSGIRRFISNYLNVQMKYRGAAAIQNDNGLGSAMVVLIISVFENP